ncbi:MAG: SUMF1/EgtB/PvdO family nonheme iron enzyme [Anaerolineae bacterium]|nr:SUMF1/EgtB/PvdO family nonheme iron enzyme [Anaerolineae bacterium]
MKNLLQALAVLLVLSPVLLTVAQDSPPQAGDTRTDEKGIAQVWVEPGCFLMGSSDAQIQEALTPDIPNWVNREILYEKPQHEVCLTQGYWIDQYEVTNEAYQAFVDDGGYTTLDYWSEDGQKWLAGQDVAALPVQCTDEPVADHPRACVTWYEAEAYAAWRGGSLPTEAQWEYAARGPESNIYPWGNTWDSALANVIDAVSTVPVGSYPDGVSWVGAHDMSGNVMEWVQDWLSNVYYARSPKDDPAGPANGRFKVEKGGWWGSNSFVARAAFRYFEDPPTYQDHHIGFRLVTNIAPE